MTRTPMRSGARRHTAIGGRCRSIRPGSPNAISQPPWRLGIGHVRGHDLRHAFAVMSLSAGDHYMAVSKMLGHASFAATLTVDADYITEGDGGKAAPRRRSTVAGQPPMSSRCVGPVRCSASLHQ